MKLHFTDSPAAVVGVNKKLEKQNEKRKLFNRHLELSELTGIVGIPSSKIKNTRSALLFNLA